MGGYLADFFLRKATSQFLIIGAYQWLCLCTVFGPSTISADFSSPAFSFSVSFVVSLILAFVFPENFAVVFPANLVFSLSSQLILPLSSQQIRCFPSFVVSFVALYSRVLFCRRYVLSLDLLANGIIVTKMHIQMQTLKSFYLYSY